MISSFSRDSEQCRKCNYYKDCDEKRRELCAYVIPDGAFGVIVEDVYMQCAMPSAISISDCANRDINMDVEKVTQRLNQELYCAFRRDIYGKNG